MFQLVVNLQVADNTNLNILDISHLLQLRNNLLDLVGIQFHRFRVHMFRKDTNHNTQVDSIHHPRLKYLDLNILAVVDKDQVYQVVADLYNQPAVVDNNREQDKVRFILLAEQGMDQIIQSPGKVKFLQAVDQDKGLVIQEQDKVKFLLVVQEEDTDKALYILVPE